MNDDAQAAVETGRAHLTPRQRDLLWALARSIQRNGYPPSIRELGSVLGMRSTATVYNHLHQLERKGYIRRSPNSPRAIEVLQLPDPDAVRKPDVGTPQTSDPLEATLDVRVLGRITAGMPILAQEDAAAGSLSVPASRAGATFALRVQGDSMEGAGIHDGDYVLVRAQDTAEHGAIVVALIGDEATVKRLRDTPDGPVLAPENPKYRSIPAREARILGRVLAIYRPL